VLWSQFVDAILTAKLKTLPVFSCLRPAATVLSNTPSHMPSYPAVLPFPAFFSVLQAEKLNGRAAMVGYFMALVVDQLTGYGLLDQQNSFLGKLLLHVTVFGILLVRSTSDLDKFKNLLDEATFYDKQWQATWTGVPRPSETEQ
jgi:hypothetical protein